MDEQALIDRWNERGTQLKALLEAHNAANLDYRLDLDQGRFWWHDPDGTPVVECQTRLLLSYSNRDRSALMSWAIPQIPDTARIAPIDGVPDQMDNCDHYSAWICALQLAEAAGAEYFYRAPSSTHWLLIGLWDVRQTANPVARHDAQS